MYSLTGTRRVAGQDSETQDTQMLRLHIKKCVKREGNVEERKYITYNNEMAEKPSNTVLVFDSGSIVRF